MNEFLRELNSMKTIEFWHKFIDNLNSKTTEDDTTKMSLLRPRFTSSAFFDSNTHPTITDQVVLCRKIAKQLVCDESNAKSKGRKMFEKRVEKSSKWVTTADDTFDDQTSEQSFHETTISEGPPNLRLLLDPRHVQDLNSLDFEPNERNANQKRSQSQSKEIVSDLTSPDIHPNRGNALFAKRQQKSSEWIVEQDVQTTTPTTTTTLMTTTQQKYCFRNFNRSAVPFARTY